MRIWLFFILLLAVQFTHARSCIDGHLHYVGLFFKRARRDVEALLSAMDQGNISRAAIMGIPVAKKWQEDEPKKPRYYAGDDADLYWYSAARLLRCQMGCSN